VIRRYLEHKRPVPAKLPASRPVIIIHPAYVSASWSLNLVVDQRRTAFFWGELWGLTSPPARNESAIAIWRGSSTGQLRACQ
jgi:hypothetical protein